VLGYYLAPLEFNGLTGQQCPVKDEDDLLREFCKRHRCDSAKVYFYNLGPAKGKGLLIIKDARVALEAVLHDSRVQPYGSEPINGLAEDIMALLKNQKIRPTEKEALVSARMGQGAFRSDVLKRWGERCSVTGSTTREAIRASHIKPWRFSNNQERLDVNNGLPLVATLDALFDSGLISFDPSGRLLVSDHLNASEKQVLGLAERRQLQKKPSASTAAYLAYHRKHVFCE